MMSEDKDKANDVPRKGKKDTVQLPKIKKSKAPAAAGCTEDLKTVSNVDVVDNMDYVSPIVPPVRTDMERYQWIPEGYTLVPNSICAGMGVDTFGSFGDMNDEYDDQYSVDMYAGSCTSDNVHVGDVQKEEGGEQVQNLPGNGLLANYRNRYQDEEGDPVSDELADLAKQIWEKGRDNESLKEMYEAYPKPKNVPVHKVDLNPELMGPAGKFGRARDMKLRAIQAAIARATVPALRIADGLLKGDNISDQKFMDTSIDTVTILANASASVNQLRRDLLKPSLDRKFQPVCSKTVSNASHMLFGEDFNNHINNMNQGVKIGRNRRFGGFQSRGRYNPYQQRGQFRRNFLGVYIFD